MELNYFSKETSKTPTNTELSWRSENEKEIKEGQWNISFQGTDSGSSKDTNSIFLMSTRGAYEHPVCLKLFFFPWVVVYGRYCFCFKSGRDFPLASASPLDCIALGCGLELAWNHIIFIF